jgi:hypothetical protein
MKQRVAFTPVDWPWTLRHPISALREWWRETRWFMQRGMYGYSECDGWNLGPYLNMWLPGAIREMAEHHCGYPGTLTDEEWTAILHQMADDLAAGSKADSVWCDPERSKALYAQHRRGMRLLGKWFWHLWD